MNARLAIRLGAVVATAISLSGCGWGLFTSREFDPVIEDYLQIGATKTSGLGSLSTTASRCTVIMRMKDTPTRTQGIVCAELAPDVGEAFVRTYAIELAQRGGHDTASSGDNAAKGRLSNSAGLSSAGGTTIAPLLYRSQGLQFFRDGMYALCQDLMNGVVDKAQYSARRRELVNTAKEIMLAEIEGGYQRRIASLLLFRPCHRDRE